jgi:hypothetical protein
VKWDGKRKRKRRRRREKKKKKKKVNNKRKKKKKERYLSEGLIFSGKRMEEEEYECVKF